MTAEPRLVILCGLPGAGKTTAARALEAGGAVRLSSDEWMLALGIDFWDHAGRARVDALQQQLAERLLVAGANVVFESGGWTRDERDGLRVAARAAAAAVELRYLDVPIDVLWERVDRRNQEPHWIGREITRAHLVEWAEAIEVPTPDELAWYDAPR